MENKAKYGLHPWQWDMRYDEDMIGVYYTEDLNCMEQIYDLIKENPKINKGEQ